MDVKERLRELGYELPTAPKPAASYLPAKRTGNLVFVSGQLPLREGGLLMTGPMTPDRSVEEASLAMEQCFLNGLAAAAQVTDLEKIRSIVRLGGFVASTRDFTAQHLVTNGASNLAERIFGEAGRHARAAVGTGSLPLNATVELEMLLEVGD